MKISVIGLGYIGLPTALMLVTHGIEVVGVDLNHKKVERLNSGAIYFKEEGMDQLFKEGVTCGIKFTTEYQIADIYIIAVPTPYIKISKKIDTEYVACAVRNVMKSCKEGTIIIIESTIAPGTIDTIVRPIIKTAGYEIGKDIHIAHAPERIIPGNMLKELKYNARIIGADSKEIAQQVKEIYASFCQGEIITTDIRTAEMTKVVENTYRDINIAFANELAKICRQAELDVYEVIRMANMHPRVNILNPGPGVGGHCIPVDPWFLVGEYPETSKLIYQARKINESMPEFVFQRIEHIMKKQQIKDIKRVGLYGLTYKEDVDDIRESPTLQLIEYIAQHLAVGIKVYDPMLSEQVVENQYNDFEAFLSEIDLVVIMVGHSHLKAHMEKIQDKIVLDTRHICPYSDNVFTL